MNPKILEATRLWTIVMPTVSAFITSLVREFPDRDDILQETAVAVIESFERYEPSRPFLNWALGIARNQVRLHCRRAGRERLIFQSETIEAIEQAFAACPAEAENLDRLTDCFELMEDRSKELCRLRYQQNLKPAAIGKRVGLAPNTVAKSLQRIRERLRACLETKSGEVSQ